jgi:hypothetical protein
MDIQYQLYRLYDYTIFVSNTESFLKMNKHIYRHYNRHLIHLYAVNRKKVLIDTNILFTLIPYSTIDNHACKWMNHRII